MEQFSANSVPTLSEQDSLQTARTLQAALRNIDHPLIHAELRLLEPVHGKINGLTVANLWVVNIVVGVLSPQDQDRLQAVLTRSYHRTPLGEPATSLFCLQAPDQPLFVQAPRNIIPFFADQIRETPNQSSAIIRAWSEILTRKSKEDPLKDAEDVVLFVPRAGIVQPKSPAYIGAGRARMLMVAAPA